MRDSRRTNALVTAALLIVAAAFAAYAALVLKWFSGPAPARPAATDARGEALERARREFRERLLDPRAHMRLSESLWRAGRPVDSFYVLHHARQLFSAEAFRKAHAEVVLGVGGPAGAARERLKTVKDPSLAAQVHAQIVRDHPGTPESRESLDQLARLAAGDENGPGGEAARSARLALEELAKADPRSPERLAALGTAHFARGDLNTALALAGESRSKHPRHPGAARIMGMIALRDRDLDGAVSWLTAAWDGDPNDLYSAAKLAELYDKRGEPEAALPYYMALYRQNPDYFDEAPAEQRIRQTLDERRESLLAEAPVEGLGTRFELDDGSLRAEAAERAGRFRDPRWVPQLIRLLDDDVEIARRNADFALFEIGKADPEAIRPRREALLGDPRPLVRIRALNLYADLDGRNALPAAIAALRDPSAAVRAYAVVMVLDHYYKGMPEAERARERWRAEERDPDALALVARFPR